MTGGVLALLLTGIRYRSVRDCFIHLLGSLFNGCWSQRNREMRRTVPANGTIRGATLQLTPGIDGLIAGVCWLLPMHISTSIAVETHAVPVVICRPMLTTFLGGYFILPASTPWVT